MIAWGEKPAWRTHYSLKAISQPPDDSLEAIMQPSYDSLGGKSQPGLAKCIVVERHS